MRTIDTKDILSLKGLKQVIQTAKICLGKKLGLRTKMPSTELSEEIEALAELIRLEALTENIE